MLLNLLAGRLNLRAAGRLNLPAVLLDLRLPVTSGVIALHALLKPSLVSLLKPRLSSGSFAKLVGLVSSPDDSIVKKRSGSREKAAAGVAL